MREASKKVAITGGLECKRTGTHRAHVRGSGVQI